VRAIKQANKKLAKEKANRMKIDVYTSYTTGSKFLCVAKGTNLHDLSLGDDVDSDLLSLSPFRTRLELDAGKEHNALDQADVLQQIAEKGYAVCTSKAAITLSK
jgi:hypothetical protein